MSLCMRVFHVWAYGRGMVCMHPCFFACADSVCACNSIWSASWALWPKSNGRKHQFHHSVFLLPLPLLLSPCIISPLFFPSSPLFSLSFSPPLFDVFLSAEVWLRCSSEHQWSEGSACLYVCVCARVLGDCLVIWAARRWVLCSAIHGRCLQMNASIHNYSLSISCSPHRLVVVFSSFAAKGEKKEKAIKAGQKQARRTQVMYLEEKKNSKGRGSWECLRGGGADSSVGIHTTHYLCFILKESLWSYLNICAWTQSPQLQILCQIYIFHFAVCAISDSVLQFHPYRDLLIHRKLRSIL